MIFVTLGTHEQPMLRLNAVLCDIAVRAPHLGPFHMQGGSTPIADRWQGSAMMPPRELHERLANADVVITHGGPATIAESRRAGKIPIVVPRQRRFGEHVDDHQLWYARRLAASLEILLIEDVGDLPQTVSRYPELTAGMPQARAHDPGEAVRRFSAAADRLLRAP